MHIAVAGNIGSGKTTLTGLLARHYGWEPHFESVDFNPYLVDFYNDMQRWSFNLQVYFLNKRLKDIVEFQNSGKELMQKMVGYPDLLVYLRSSIPNLVEQIQKRGREYENSIRIDYLKGLNDRYEQWISEYKGELLIVDVDTCRFEDRKEDFSQVCDQIDARLFGLFQ